MKLVCYRRAALSFVLAATLAACGGSGDPVELRATQFGQVVGIDDSLGSGTYAWKGIPFAKAPVDTLRWKAPVDPDAWTTARDTKAFANACVQYGRIYGPGSNNRYDETIGTTLGTSVGSEDCLALNIWRPTAIRVRSDACFARRMSWPSQSTAPESGS